MLKTIAADTVAHKPDTTPDSQSPTNRQSAGGPSSPSPLPTRLMTTLPQQRRTTPTKSKHTLI